MAEDPKPNRQLKGKAEEPNMKVIIVGTGTIGSAVGKLLKEYGHEVISVGRKSGDYQADISETASLKKLFANIGPFDAVANAAGDVSPALSSNSPTSNGRSPSPEKGSARSIWSASRSRTLRTRAPSRSSRVS